MEHGVIRRKLALRQPVAVQGGADRAWPLALARAARDCHGLALDASPAGTGPVSLAELLERVPERALILLLEGPGGGSGVLMLCPEVLAALIEVQTLGKVTALPVLPRRPTRTDAAMVMDWADQALAGLEEALQADEDLVWAGGFRHTEFLEEPRSLPLLLDDAPWQIVPVACDLASARQGQVILALPAEGRGQQPRRPETAAPSEDGEGQAFAAALTEQVLGAEAEVQAVLLRLNLPLADLMALQPGQMLPLPGAALDRIDLCGTTGRTCAQGRLGQQRGMRAVRLVQCGEGPAPAEATTLARTG